MDDQNRPNITTTNCSTLPPAPPLAAAVEQVRTRWTPKPEQILILESIFNSGMVNPPKDETVRIRKLLEKFGAVGDANVFYWFQNRRSRSRRHQRRLQASLAMQQAAAALSGHLSEPPSWTYSLSTSSSGSSCGGGGGPGGLGFFPFSYASSSSSSFMVNLSPNDLFTISHQSGITPFMCSSDHVSKLLYQTGTIPVFIDGVPSEVPRGPIDMKASFGDNVIIVHSSGQILPVDEQGILIQSLQMGYKIYLTGSSLMSSSNLNGVGQYNA
ncbi:hypothetical protein ZIOFF_001601 [Zingiber officinale]|uniref:Homeobox domain-containing protein n=1 Tax=Zingiber officinale TaxID=94328 RepID=A0A8J5IMX7_ZINOF|nr:hypothetical protein ZIOFF_001601 [Zingiber officinale]